MLNSLLIENYALIDRLEIQFEQGLNIITGETGAGKSILLGALGMLLGQRADTSVLKNKERSCIVEGTFDVRSQHIATLFEANEIEPSGEVIIRRVINPAGKSRTFINDQPVTLAVLREFGDRLVDIHSQHQNMLLQNAAFQLNVVDTLAGNRDMLEKYRAAFAQQKSAEQHLRGLEEMAQQSKSEADYHAHLYSELDAAKLQAGEQADLEDEQQQLMHAEEIARTFAGAATLLQSDDVCATKLLREAALQLEKMADVFSKAEPLAERLHSALIDVKDVARDVEAIAESTEVNEARLSEVNARLDLLYDLQKKHRVGTLDELIAVRDELAKKVQFVGNIDEQIAAARSEFERLHAEAKAQAEALSAKRSKVFAHIEQHVAGTLKDLGIPNATMKVERAALPSLTPSGLDDIRFLFSANKGMAPQDIVRVASGGEIARLMLSLKSLVAFAGELPTIIFDEIDTGVSGEVADRMGSIISELGKFIQVINITHLPQIASKGRTHFRVYKDESGAGAVTNLRRLSADERVQEIAKMLSGASISEAAVMNAREMLNE